MSGPAENLKKRFGDKKPAMSVVPIPALRALQEVMANGADKYGERNWRVDPVDAKTYYNAIMRHLLVWMEGEDTDPDSGLGHLAHVMASCAILIDAGHHGTLSDNRGDCVSKASGVSVTFRFPRNKNGGEDDK